jgi:hypothetical protein
MEWIVTPPAFKAAIPVGATTIVFLCVDWIISFNKVVLPVPAFQLKIRIDWFD